MRFFESAFRNLTGAAELPGGKDVLPVLVLTATASEPGFKFVRDWATGRARPKGYGNWQATRMADGTSVMLTSAGRRLLVVAGAQVATGEALEVLLLGTEERVPDGAPIRAVLDHGVERGVCCVVPWSPGKWWLQRGNVVREIIDSYTARDVCLGDTAQRPRIWGEPRLFGYARAKGWSVLPGTDPLPFPSYDDRAGSLAVAVDAHFDFDAPTASLLSALAPGDGAGCVTGNRESLRRFVSGQLRMQVLKRRSADSVSRR